MKLIENLPLFGDDTNDVRLLQTRLIELGFNPGIVDGIFGEQTKSAVSKLQKANDLPGSGIIGPRTLNLLSFEIQKTKNNSGYAPLSWERNHPERKDWSVFVFATVESLFDKFSLCDDVIDFRSDYNLLNKQQQINIWGELISAICKFESGWKPTSWMVETTMNIDPITGKQVKSEGLMQLSYQDKINYPKLPCRFDWEKDKLLDVNDSRKTIFDPLINLEFGINILARQMERHQNIALTSHVYWAVLKEGGKYSRITEIAKMVNMLGI